MKKVLVVILATVFCLSVYSEVNASFFFTRYQSQRVKGKNIFCTYHILNIDWKEWDFGVKTGTVDVNGFMFIAPFIHHDLPFLGKNWKGGFRFEHISPQGDDSFAPSICYGGVKEVWKGLDILLLFQADYFLGDQERLELWGDITIPLFSQMPGDGWRLGMEGFLKADRFGKRNYQLRFPRIGYRFPGFGPFNSVTPFAMFEHRWDKWSGKIVESNSVFGGITFNF